MTKADGDKPNVASFADHQVITPPNKLKGAWTRTAAADDPVARAEAALAELSTEFTGWFSAKASRTASLMKWNWASHEIFSRPPELRR